MTSQAPSPRAMTEGEFSRFFLKELGYPRRPQFLELAAFARRMVMSCGAGSLVIDVGAGEARWSKLFADCHYVAVDRAVGDDTWDYSRLDAIGDAFAMPIRSGVADVTLAMALVGHLPRTEAFLHEIRRMLKPGGHFFALSEFANAEHQAPFDFQRLTRFGLRHALESAGFVDIDIRGSNSFYVSLLNLLESWIWKTGGRDAPVLMRGFMAGIVHSRLISLMYPFRSGADSQNIYPVYFLVRARAPLGGGAR